jgi:polyphenol oxidase
MNKSNFPPVIKSKLFNKFPELLFSFSTRDWMDYNNAQLDLLYHKGIKKRFHNFFKHINVPTEKIVTQKQIHSTNINYVTIPGHLDNSDGMYTDKKNLFLTIKAADCIPIFLYDPERKVIAGVHSGWKGTHRKILSKMINELKTRFRVKPENLIAFIGPGISVRNYEVNKEVAGLFPSESKIIKKGKYYLDLKKDNYHQLTESGVPEKNIEISTHCTFSDSDLFFSYRKNKTNTGRMLGVIGITGK